MKPSYSSGNVSDEEHTSENAATLGTVSTLPSALTPVTPASPPSARVAYSAGDRSPMSGRRATGIIGYYSSAPINAFSQFEAELIGGLMRGCGEENKNLLLLGAHDGSPARIEALHADITGGKIDGLITRFAPVDPLRDKLRKARFPLVTLADPHPGLPAVVVDDMGGFGQVAHYLADQEHKRVLFRGYAGKVSSARRRAGFADVAARRGITVLEDVSLQTAHLSSMEVEILRMPDDARPTAAVCWTDSTARATLKHADALGLQVPGDLAVVGFNGLTLSRELVPRLTTICAPWREVAAQSVQMLCELLRGNPVPDLTTLPVTLVEGETA